MISLGYISCGQASRPGGLSVAVSVALRDWLLGDSPFDSWMAPRNVADVREVSKGEWGSCRTNVIFEGLTSLQKVFEMNSVQYATHQIPLL